MLREKLFYTLQVTVTEAPLLANNIFMALGPWQMCIGYSEFQSSQLADSATSFETSCQVCDKYVSY